MVAKFLLKIIQDSEEVEQHLLSTEKMKKIKEKNSFPLVNEMYLKNEGEMETFL